MAAHRIMRRRCDSVSSNLEVLQLWRRQLACHVPASSSDSVASWGRQELWKSPVRALTWNLRQLRPLRRKCSRECIFGRRRRSKMPEKTQFFWNDAARSFQIKRYKYGPLQEEEYHKNIQTHRFGHSQKKGGHDCLRHYEILAAGAVPVLQDLEHMPPSILTTLPKAMMMDAKKLFAEPWDDTEDGAGTLPGASGVSPHFYEAMVSELLNYTAKHLTTEVAARKILDTMGLGSLLEDLNNTRRPKPTILFLSCVAIDNFPSFLAASVFHGLVSLLGDSVIDVPEYDYAYSYEPWELQADPDLEFRVRQELWGQGYTVGFKHKRRPHIDRTNIQARIKAKEFDLIVFARMSPYEPCNFWYPFHGHGLTVPQFFEDVHGWYPPERVALLYGDDSGFDDAVVRTNVRRMGSLERALGIVFMRELLPFVSDGPMNQALRPVDHNTLQMGCFYEEWLNFFGRWQKDIPNGGREPGGLRACVAQQPDCNPEEVEAYFASPHFELQRPGFDPPILHQFCRSGFTLRAALLVARLGGPQACAEDEHCRLGCDFVIRMYARGLIGVQQEAYYAEFGVTSTQVMFLLNMGCGHGALAMQPAAAQVRRIIAVVADDLLWPVDVVEKSIPLQQQSSRSPYAGTFQILYLLRQGYQVVLVGDVSADSIDGSLYGYMEQGRLVISDMSRARCTWLAGAATGQDPEISVPVESLYYVHFDPSEGEAAAEAYQCFAYQAEASLPRFISLQQRPSADAEELRSSVTRLAALGYRRFKASRLVASAMGAPFGDFAPDALTGSTWRTASGVLAGRLALAPGGQLHAAL